MTLRQRGPGRVGYFLNFVSHDSDYERREHTGRSLGRGSRNGKRGGFHDGMNGAVFRFRALGHGHAVLRLLYVFCSLLLHMIPLRDGNDPFEGKDRGRCTSFSVYFGLYLACWYEGCMALHRGVLGARDQSLVKTEYCFVSSVLRGEGASILSLKPGPLEPLTFRVTEVASQHTQTNFSLETFWIT